MATVIKRDGKRQAFSPMKVKNSILKAAKDARISPMRANELVSNIVQPVSNLVRAKNIIKATDIRRSILGRLDRQLKAVSNSWRKHEKKSK